MRPELVRCKSIQIQGCGAFIHSFFAIPDQSPAENAAVDGTMAGWAGSKPHPIGIKSALDCTEQIF
jgi:hypothetical protein